MKEEKEFVKELEEVYKECEDDLGRVSGERQFIASACEIATVMMQIRMHMIQQ